MSLLLKALKQVDRRPVASVADEPSVVAAPQLPEVPRKPISLAALFEVPKLEAEHPVAQLPEPLTIDVVAPADDALSDLSTTNETPLDRLEALQSLLATEAVSCVLEANDEIVEVPLSLPLPKISPPVPTALETAFPIRPEIRDLCDHLFAKHALPEHATLLLVDAGRVIQDAAWAMEFAVAVAAKRQADGRNRGVATAAPKILLVEAAGPQCGIAPAAQVNTHPGLCALLRGDTAWRDAVQPTTHPHVEFLGRGIEPLWPDKAARLSTLWNELRNHFDLLLVATGPWIVAPESAAFPIGPAAELFAPLADAAVLCVELDGTTQLAALETQAALKNRGVNVLGCVVRGRNLAA